MNHKMWAQWKDFRLNEEEVEPALEMVRALNTLQYEISELEYKKNYRVKSKYLRN